MQINEGGNVIPGAVPIKRENFANAVKNLKKILLNCGVKIA